MRESFACGSLSYDSKNSWPWDEFDDCEETGDDNDVNAIVQRRNLGKASNNSRWRRGAVVIAAVAEGKGGRQRKSPPNCQHRREFVSKECGESRANENYTMSDVLPANDLPAVVICHRKIAALSRSRKSWRRSGTKNPRVLRGYSIEDIFRLKDHDKL